MLDTRPGAVPYLAGGHSIADIACNTWAKGALQTIGAAHPEGLARFADLNRRIAEIDARPAVQAGMKVPH